MRKLLLFVICLPLFLLAGWFLLSDDDRRTQEASPAAGPGEPPLGAAPAELATPSPYPRNEEPEVLEGERAPVAAPARRSAESVEQSAPFEPVPEDGFAVLVVEAESGAPLPHAVVGFLSQSDVDEETMLAFMTGGLDIDGFFREHGRNYRADEQGLVLVPRAEDSLLCSRHGSLWAVTEVDGREQEPFRFELNFDPELQVVVQDAQARPIAGVPVSLRIKNSRFVQDFLTAPTDETGLARILHAYTLLEEIGDEVVFAGLSVVSAEPVEVQIDPDEIPADPYVLTLPPTGSVEVLVRDNAGEPYEELVFVQLAPTSGEVLQRSGLGALQRGVSPGGASRNTDTGRAGFEHVALGLELVCTVATTHGKKPVTTLAPGPLRSGQSVRIEVTLAESLPVLVARLVNAEGVPVSERVVEARIRVDGPRGGGSQHQSRYTSDAQGVVRIPLDEPGPRQSGQSRGVGPLPHFALEAGESRSLELTTAAEATQTGALVDVSFPLHPGDNDLGEVRLLPPPLLFSGRAVDPDGEPVESSVLPYRRRGSEDQSWEALYFYRTRTAEDGTFAIHGWLVDRDLAAAAHAEGYVGRAQQEVALGATDVELVLDPSGEIHGRILLDEGLSPKALRVLVQNEASPEEKLRIFTPDDEGAFKVHGAPLTPHSLRVQIQGEAESLVQIDDIPVRRDPEFRAPRLNPIDLRSRLFGIQLEVVDPDGEPLRALVYYRSPGAESYGGRARSVEGEGAQLLSQRPALDLRIESRGFQTKELLNASGRQRVVLEPGFVVQLSLGRARPELEGHQLLLYLRNENGRPQVASFTPDGVAEVRLSSAGKYRINLHLKTAGPRPLVPVGDPLTITVREDRQVQYHELALSDAVLEAALRELR